MPSFFSSVTGRTSATLFEIRLENDIIVLRGDENSASSQYLKGHVVLCLPAALKVEDVHLRMTGQLKVGWNDQRITPTGVSNNRVDKTIEIFSHRWPPFVGHSGPGSSSRGLTLPAGNYDWPFELVIPGTMAESVEGLHDTHIVYKLKATVARGKLAYDLHAWKPVRIVRTLDPSALELAHAMTVENIWPNKIEYQLIIPQKAIMFGTAINIQMRFTSLLKGLKIGKIKCQLIETQEFTIAGATSMTDRYWKYSRDVESWTFELDEEQHYQDLINEDGQDGYTMSEHMPLPKRLSRCIQDVDVHGIKIRHKVKFNIALHNPDGHISELRATLPITIFISPNMPMNADGCLVDQTPMSTQSQDISSHAPPLYEESHLDQLYLGMEQSGLMTPAPQSGMNTPFYAQSRSGSHENLAALGGHPTGAVQPNALASRLQNLDMNTRLNAGSRNSSFISRFRGHGSGGNTPHHPHELPAPQEVASPHSNEEAPGYFDAHFAGNGSGTNSANHRNSVLSSHGLDDNLAHDHHHASSSSLQPGSNTQSGAHTPEHVDYTGFGDLSKVPSYSTAIRTPTRGMSYTDSLGPVPDYETATSAPPSPLHMPGSSADNSNAGSPSARRNPFSAISSSIGFTPIHPPPQAHIGDHEGRTRIPLHRNRETIH